MDKKARGRSSDLVQEKLRSDKDEWNSEVSETIFDLIGLKKGLNGREDKSHGIPASSIKDPLPDAVDHTLAEVADGFRSLLQEGRSIIDSQESYSHNRKKPFQAEASWVGSRLLSRLTLLGKEDRKYRLALINGLADVENLLKEFEQQIGSSNADVSSSFQNFIKIVSKIENIIYDELINLKSIHKGEVIKKSPLIEDDILSDEKENENLSKEELKEKQFLKREELKRKLKKEFDESEDDEEEKPKFEITYEEKYKSLIEDSEFRKMLAKLMLAKNKIPAGLVEKFTETNEMLDGLEIEVEDMIKKSKQADNLFPTKIDRVEKARQFILNIYNQIFSTKAISFKDFIPLVKSASNIKRLWQKMLLNVNSDTSDLFKIKIIEQSEEIRDAIDILSDALESRDSSWKEISSKCKPLFILTSDLIGEIILWLKSYQKSETAKNFSTSTNIDGPIARRDQRPIIEERFYNALVMMYKTLLNKSEKFAE